VEEGQNQPWEGPEVQVGKMLIELASKNSPFEPISMKLWLNVLPLNTVVNSPDESAGYIVTPEGILFGCVPMPRMRLPLTEVTPPGGTLGSCNIIPLLSYGRCEIGFCTWLESGAVEAVHVNPLQI
jgi:hypothetical protein